MLVEAGDPQAAQLQIPEGLAVGAGLRGPVASPCSNPHWRPPGRDQTSIVQGEGLAVPQGVGMTLLAVRQAWARLRAKELGCLALRLVEWEARSGFSLLKSRAVAASLRQGARNLRFAPSSTHSYVSSYGRAV
jgi:hypothetical protein